MASKTKTEIPHDEKHRLTLGEVVWSLRGPSVPFFATSPDFYKIERNGEWVVDVYRIKNDNPLDDGSSHAKSIMEALARAEFYVIEHRNALATFNDASDEETQAQHDFVTALDGLVGSIEE